MATFTQLFPEDVEIILYRGLANVPPFDGSDVLPAQVEDLRKLIAGADGIVICTPEYAFGIPGALKNALDWTVGQGDLMNKPTALITASTGGEHGHKALMLVLQALSAHVNDCELIISGVRSKVKEDKVTDKQTVEQLKALRDRFVESIREHSLRVAAR